MPRRIGILLAISLFAISGCFMGYDSRWGQQKRAQKNFVQAEAPNTLRRGTAASGRSTASRTARIRVYASRAYTAEILDWQRRFARVVDDATAIVGPIIDARLEVVETKAWALKQDDENVSRLVAELHEADSGEDVDWVVGLVGSIPRFASSFHELGAGVLIGKHIVLRAINNAAEYQVIEEGLSELSEQERDRFRSARLAHKLTSVLLHELGHTLGAMHELNPKSIMNPAYSRETTDYSSAAVDMMRLVFAHRTASGNLDEAARPALLEILRRDPSPWVEAEREHALERYSDARHDTPAAQASAGRGAVVSVGPQPVPAGLEALSDSERRAYFDAKASKDARNFQRASELMQALVEAHPTIEVLQELRCQIASQRGLPWKDIETECNEFMKLQRKPKASGQ